LYGKPNGFTRPRGRSIGRRKGPIGPHERPVKPHERSIGWRAAVLSATALLIATAAAVAGCGSQASTGKTSHTASSVLAAKLDAPGLIEPARQAPEIVLHDYTGRLVRLSQFHGKAVLLTFIYDHCHETCPILVSKLHTTLELLGARAKEVQVVAVSVDPVGDTPKTVKTFLATHRMTGRMDYLIGSRKQLAPIWKEYDISAEGTPDARESPENRTVSHTALIYGITAGGQWLALYNEPVKPSEMAHDVPLLASAP
jgi:protein SCO1